MHKVVFPLFLVCCLCSFSAFAQQDTTTEDFSQYANVAPASGETERVLCNSKIAGAAPSRLIAIGYEMQGSAALSMPGISSFAASQAEVKSVYGMRVNALIPVINNRKGLFAVGMNFLEAHYGISSADAGTAHPLGNTLFRHGLTTAGLQVQAFKPVSEQQFFVVSAQADCNGDFRGIRGPALNMVKCSAALLWGFKPHDRLMWGFGVSRNYRAGELNYLPVFMYNYSFPDRRWGLDVLLPARAALRYAPDTRHFFTCGYELEGNSYRLNALMRESSAGYRALELRRSELRFKLSADFPLHGFTWCSVQAGYRHNFRYKIDEGEFFRGFFGNQTYISENSLSGTWFATVLLTLVAP